MSDEEIMKKFNETFNKPESGLTNNKTEDNITPYKTSVNYNINNVEQNTVNNNISSQEKLEIKDLLSTDNNTNSLPNSTVAASTTQVTELPKYDNNVNYNYVPTYNSQKQKKPTIKLTGENLIFLLIVVILFVFILIIPNIYDVIRQIKMR